MHQLLKKVEIAHSVRPYIEKCDTCATRTPALPLRRHVIRLIISLHSKASSLVYPTQGTQHSVFGLWPWTPNPPPHSPFLFGSVGHTITPRQWRRFMTVHAPRSSVQHSKAKGKVVFGTTPPLRFGLVAASCSARTTLSPPLLDVGYITFAML